MIQGCPTLKWERAHLFEIAARQLIRSDEHSCQVLQTLMISYNHRTTQVRRQHSFQHYPVMDQHLKPILQSHLTIPLSNPLSIHHVRDLIDQLEIKNHLTGSLCADLNFHHSCKLLNVVSYWPIVYLCYYY